MAYRHTELEQEMARLLREQQERIQQLEQRNQQLDLAPRLRFPSGTPGLTSLRRAPRLSFLAAANLLLRYIGLFGCLNCL